MVTAENLASKLYTILINENPNGEIKEWRLLGQEKDGILLFSWNQSRKNEKSSTNIGFYDCTKNKLKNVYSFNRKVNCIQASIDSNRTFLVFVTKEQSNDNKSIYIYRPFLHKIGSENEVLSFGLARSKQIMVQFLYTKQSLLSETLPVSFLLMIHKEAIHQYQFKNPNELLSLDNLTSETLVNNFLWAQWQSVQQTLYYIHQKKPKRGFIEGEEEVAPADVNNKLNFTLSGLQFHDELPRESVLNIPLNLPHMPSTQTDDCIYEDDAVPLRVHDCTLDLMVLTDSQGLVCICHHYLYQPIQTTELNDDDDFPIHLAYSATVLHQSCVLHCVVPDIPWNKAKTIRPLFSLHNDHLLVFLPEICTHLLDIGLMHEPCCHITTKPLIENTESQFLCLSPVHSLGDNLAINLATLDLVDMTMPIDLLVDTFKSQTLTANRLSILHYLILHSGELDLASELISWQSENPFLISFPQMLREYLIGSSYAAVQRNLPPDANKLIKLLPVTTQKIGSEIEVKVNDKTISLTQDVLWNTSMMLLSPQQRIVPYRSDIWVKLWDQLAKLTKGKPRFKPSQVVEKLMISLTCYQPEVLSRSSTPMSPGGTIGSSTSLDVINSQGIKRSQVEYLPFYEIESCTASKQEHIISVNLRELNMYLLKQSSEERVSRFQWQLQTPIHVHAVATRYITAQLDQSRQLCQILCKAATYDPRYEHDKGFLYINNASEEKRYILFIVLERYYWALESIAFPLPQGFTSFFTFLGYKTLNFDVFVQYVHRNVFELQVDVMKVILSDMDNSATSTKRKLHLLSLLSRARARRLLNTWNHPVSLMLRAREHSLNILSGEVGPPTTKKGSGDKIKGLKGIPVFPSTEQVSPLDSFFDLLTAKASLTDIDFGLLIEATEHCHEEIF